eukprot:TRINITY_DN9595_c0_g1_i3.p1 TRINITY_DN9595_c0_g1~~TRINITY_DN9595_c0_g1_i3.p1  ORF type:complete len:255 (-),score=40.66 TRINITY_DN9595_c0_g1_i3:6-770(-)
MVVFERQPSSSDLAWREIANVSTSGGILDVAFNDAATMLVAGTLPGNVLVYALSAKSKQVLNLVRRIDIPGSGMTGGVSFFPLNPTVFVIGDAHGAVHVCDADSGQIQRKVQIHGSSFIRRLKFDLSGKQILTACYDSIAALTNTDTWEPVAKYQGHTSSLNDACFSYDDKLVFTTSDDHTVKIFNTQTGAMLHTFPEGHYVVTTTRIRRRPWDTIGRLSDLCTLRCAEKGLDHSRLPQHIRDEVAAVRKSGYR